MPDLSEEVYTVRSRLYRNETYLDRLASLPVTERQEWHVRAQRAAAGSKGKLKPYDIAYP